MKINRKISNVGIAVGFTLSIVIFTYFAIAKNWEKNEVESLSKKEQLFAESPFGALIWSQNGTIFGGGFNKWAPFPITKGENPRWSPDGTRILFTRGNDAWIIDKEVSNKMILIKDVVTEYGTGAYWANGGKSVVAINRKDSRKVLLLDLESRKIGLIHDESAPPYHGYHFSQAAELRIDNRFFLTFTTDAGHKSMIIDLVKKKYITNNKMLQGDCGPAWTPDNQYIVMTRRNRKSLNRPIFIAKFDESARRISASEYLIGKGWCGDVSISNDSKYVLYSASGDIFIWKIDDRVKKPQHGVKIVDNNKSSGPNLYIFKASDLPSAFLK